MSNHNPLKEIQQNPIVAVIDLETGSLRNKAHIFTAGMVIGNILTGEIFSEHYYRVASDGQEGRISDSETVTDFWGDLNKVSREARREIFDLELDRIPLEEVLVRLNEDICGVVEKLDIKNLHVMGNGSEFDNAIILEAYKELGVKPAWPHGNNQSLRTLVWMGRLLLGIDPKYQNEFIGIRHHALDDARDEFNYSTAIVQKFKEALEGAGKE